MAWETHGGGRYYYANRRVEGRVVRAYHGTGAVAELAAGLIEQARRDRADRDLALAAEKARLGPADRAMAALEEACGLMAEATLTAAGYHRYDYRWRRRHVRSEAR